MTIVLMRFASTSFCVIGLFPYTEPYGIQNIFYSDYHYLQKIKTIQGSTEDILSSMNYMHIIKTKAKCKKCLRTKKQSRVFM